MKREKLSSREIWLLIYIAQRTGLTGRIILGRKHRERVVPLWRRHLVEIWWRQVADDESNRGPYFSLTVEGHQLASAILAARDERRRRKSDGASPSTEQPSALAA